MNLLIQSLLLDHQLIKTKIWPFFMNINFILIKYYLIIKHLLKKFVLGKNYIIFFKQKIFYDSRFGLAGYQRQIVSNGYPIKLLCGNNIKTIIDIGANVGFFSLIMNYLYPKAKIYSYEPIPLIYKCLQNNFKKNTQVKTYNFALSNKSGHAKMTFNENTNALSKISNRGNVMVNITTLDKIIYKNKIAVIDILKIDTEGFEDFILEGGHKALSITKYLLIEVSLTKDIKYTLTSLISKLYSKKFNFQLIYYRNFENKSEGETHNFDFLMKNVEIIST